MTIAEARKLKNGDPMVRRDGSGFCYFSHVDDDGIVHAIQKCQIRLTGQPLDLPLTVDPSQYVKVDVIIKN